MKHILENLLCMYVWMDVSGLFLPVLPCRRHEFSVTIPLTQRYQTVTEPFPCRYQGVSMSLPRRFHGVNKEKMVLLYFSKYLKIRD